MMVNLLSILFGGGLLGYVALWMVGCRVPGTGKDPFKGWNYLYCTDPDSEKRRNRD